MDNSGVLSLGNPLLTGHFEKDIKFLQLFLLLCNQSCPIRRIDLKWAEEGPSGRAGLRSETLSTQAALAGPFGALLAGDGAPEPEFCNLIHDHGRHEEESCAISDRAAEIRARRSQQPEVYRCHAGLVDIAVPVIAGGQYIATLLAGQVLRDPPSTEGFIQIRKDTAALTYLNYGELEKAYWNAPVVTDADIERTIRLLEIFAEYLVVIWTRLSALVRDQERRLHEIHLTRKEFALALLEGESSSGPALRELMDRIGFTEYPNRVLVVSFEPGEYRETGGRFDVDSTQAIQAVDQLCAGLPNVCCAWLRKHGICIFFRDRSQPGGGVTGTDPRTLAGKVLQAITSHCPLKARVGIGATKPDWRELSDSYHEARIALASSTANIAAYQEFSAGDEEVFAAVARLCRSIAERRLTEARVQVLELPVLVNRRPNRSGNRLESQRHLLIYALDAIEYTTREQGSTRAQGEAFGACALDRASTPFELQIKFVEAAESVIESIRNLFVGRPQMLVDRAVQLIESSLNNPVTAQRITIRAIASAVGISADHLSRLFKKSTGLTFERFLIVRRVEAARRLLLEPLASVAEVSDRLGFSDPAYFARVFRKMTGCSPSKYRNNPIRLESTPENGVNGAVHPH